MIKIKKLLNRINLFLKKTSKKDDDFRIKMFETEINLIKNERYRESVKNLLLLVPDYFFERPASVTGKYHPDCSNGSGGLVRHTKVAVAIANEILSLEYMKKEFTKNERDLLKIALIFHDSFKSGEPERRGITVKNHPLLAADFIKNNQNKTKFTDKEIAFLGKVISSHMGQWAYSNDKKQVLPKPKDKYDIFVHMCDFLASRKFLNVKFFNNEIVKE